MRADDLLDARLQGTIEILEKALREQPEGMARCYYSSGVISQVLLWLSESYRLTKEQQVWMERIVLLWRECVGMERVV